MKDKDVIERAFILACEDIRQMKQGIPDESGPLSFFIDKYIYKARLQMNQFPEFRKKNKRSLLQVIKEIFGDKNGN